MVLLKMSIDICWSLTLLSLFFISSHAYKTCNEGYYYSGISASCKSIPAGQSTYGTTTAYSSRSRAIVKVDSLVGCPAGSSTKFTNASYPLVCKACHLGEYAGPSASSQWSNPYNYNGWECKDLPAGTVGVKSMPTATENFRKSFRDIACDATCKNMFVTYYPENRQAISRDYGATWDGVTKNYGVSGNSVYYEGTAASADFQILLSTSQPVPGNNQGLISISYDSGISWQVVVKGGNYRGAVISDDTQTMVVLSARGAHKISKDKGRNWDDWTLPTSPVNTNQCCPWGIAATPSLSHIAFTCECGPGGAYVTKDMGKTVQRITPAIMPDLTAKEKLTGIACNEDFSIIVIADFNSQAVYVSRDSGDSWNKATKNTDMNVAASFYGMAMSRDATITAIVSGSIPGSSAYAPIRYSAYDGMATGFQPWSTWGGPPSVAQPLTMSTFKLLRAAAGTPDGLKLFVIQYGGQASYSIDGGNTWSDPTYWSKSTANPEGLPLTTGAEGVAVSNDFSIKLVTGQQTPIYINRNTAKTWDTIFGGAKVDWRSVACNSDCSTVIGVSFGSSVYVSQPNTNLQKYTIVKSAGARNWGFASTPDLTTQWITCENGPLIKSIDGGKTWTDKGSEQNYRGIATSADGEIVVAMVHNGIPVISKDSGETWSNAGNELKLWVGLTASHDMSVLTATEDGAGYVYRSFDLGTTWLPTGYLHRPVLAASGGAKAYMKVSCLKGQGPDLRVDKWLTVFDNKDQCNVQHSFNSDVLDVAITKIRVVTVGGDVMEWPVTETLRDLVMKQPWLGNIGETDQYKHLAGTSTNKMENLYLFNDHDAGNYNKKTCPAAGTSGFGRQTSSCPGTPYGLVSLAASNAATMWGDYGECNYQTSSKWGFIVREMYVMPPEPWETVFNNEDQCNIQHSFPSTLLDKDITAIRVVTTSGQAHEWPVMKTLRQLVLTSPWLGNIGETDQYKQLAGVSSNKMENLYIFNDHDAGNYDKKGCPAAGTSGFGRQTSSCPGTPNGLVSLAASNAATMWGDYGACNYQTSSKWGFIVREMYVIKRPWLTVFDNKDQCNVQHSFNSDVLDVAITKIRVVTVGGDVMEWPVTETLRDLVMKQPWLGNIGETDQYKHLAGTSTNKMENLYLFNDHDAGNYNKKTCPAAGTSGFGRQTSSCPGTPYGLVSLAASNAATMWGDYGECNYQTSSKWGFIVREMYVMPSQPYTTLECSDCSRGTYSSSPTSGCESVPAGNIPNAMSGATAVTPCPTGKYADARSYRCIGCPKGTFASQPGSAKCVSCSAGQYQSKKGRSKCFSCRPGTYSSTTGALSCTDCGIGTYTGSKGSTSCSLCSAGKYAAVVQSRRCALCPTGKYASGGIKCIVCAAGAFGPNQGRSRCLLCSAGKYMASTGSSACISVPAGGYSSQSSGATSYDKCGVGRYSMKGASACSACPIGRYSNSQAAGSCTPASPGSCVSTTGASVATLCSNGTFSSISGQSTCTPCPRNMYNAQSGALVCMKCPVGSYTLTTGGGSVDTCLQCAPGTYAVSSSPNVCLQCAPGSISPGGAKQCTQCPIGSYERNNQCLSCKSGYVSNVVGATTCNMCKQGTFSFQGDTACSACPVGRFGTSLGASTCQACPVGSVQPDTGATSCQKCGSGRFNNVISSANCTQCAAGMYSAINGATACQVCANGTYAPTTDMNSCLACPRGSVTSGTGASVCTPCAAGTAATGNNKCTLCEKGKYTASSGATVCSTCGAGNINADEAGCVKCEVGQMYNAGSTVCISCSKGKYASSDQTQCIPCEVGTYNDEVEQTSCKACPIGSYAPISSSFGCSQCAPGTYIGTTGSSACQRCAAGRYSPLSGESECLPCKPGTASSTGASVCASCEIGKTTSTTDKTICTSCASGTYGAMVGSVASCLICPVGRYQGNRGQTSCMACPSGYYSDKNGANQCTVCPPGLSSGPGAGGCGMCHSGTYSPALGSNDCIACDVGKYSSAGETSCVNCPAGKFAPTTGLSSCTICSAGDYSQAGASACSACSGNTYTTIEAGRCTPCPSGSQTNDKNTACVACQPGSYYDSATNSCEQCSVGKYQNLPQQTQCFPCALGSYTNHVGQTACTSCAKGNYGTIDAGVPSCKPCPQGRYTNVQGMTACAACPSGSYASFTGSFTCSQCKSGTFSGVGSSKCSVCAAGRYSSTSGSSACQACPRGKSQGDIGQFKCLKCPAGEFASGTGAQSCKPCPIGRYMQRTGAYYCVSCRKGKYAPTIGSATCTPCDRGTYSRWEASACTKCAAGRYGFTGTYCTQCARGRYSYAGSSSCSPCVSGRYSQSWYGSKSCLPCPVGRWSRQLSTYCIRCSKGYYAPNTSTKFCSKCTAGKYQPKFGASSCLSCTSGSYRSSRQSSITCRACPIGRYAATTGSSQCTSCPMGKQNTVSASSSCTTCQPGSVTGVSTGGFECKQCEAGSFANVSATMGKGALTGTCTLCSPGMYADSLGSTSCKPCLQGQYSTGSGKTACQVCEAGYISNSNVAATGCIACGPGRYAKMGVPMGSVTSIGSICSACPISKYSTNTANADCIDCDIGQMTDGVGSTACFDVPTSTPTSTPTTYAPTSRPTANPTTSGPTRSPISSGPTSSPVTSLPTATPTSVPTSTPSAQPSEVPNAAPSAHPTIAPSASPSKRPSSMPTSFPSAVPSGKPTVVPSRTPTASPTSAPSQPTSVPTTTSPTSAPTSSMPSKRPSARPSGMPSGMPTKSPTSQPTTRPSGSPSTIPSSRPSAYPSSTPSGVPSRSPTVAPSAGPTVIPSSSPSAIPSTTPTASPSGRPSAEPSPSPSGAPSAMPSITHEPTPQPSSKPTLAPTVSAAPTISEAPTVAPTLPQNSALSNNGNASSGNSEQGLVTSLAVILCVAVCVILLYFAYKRYKKKDDEEEGEENTSPYERWMRNKEGKATMDSFNPEDVTNMKNVDKMVDGNDQISHQQQSDAYSMDMQEIYAASGSSGTGMGGGNSTLSQASTHNPMLSPHHNPMLYGGGHDDGALHTPVGLYTPQNDGMYGSGGHPFESKDPFDYNLGDSVHNPLASNPVLEMQKRLSVRNSVVGKKKPMRRTTMSQSQVSNSATKSFISMDANR